MGLFQSAKPQRAGTAAPGTAALGSGVRLRSNLPPQTCAQILEQIFDGYRPRRYPDLSLQAVGYPLTPGNRARLAQQLTMMLLIKCQEIISSQEGPRGAERFIETHKRRADRTSLTGPPRSALHMLAEWNPGVLPYIQDLPLRYRAMLLIRVDQPGGFWSELEKAP